MIERGETRWGSRRAGGQSRRTMYIVSKRYRIQETKIATARPTSATRMAEAHEARGRSLMGVPRVRIDTKEDAITRVTPAT